MSLVSVKNLTFVPQGASEPALDNLSLSLPRGSRTLLIGANGGQSLSLSTKKFIIINSKAAGKSTLLQILAGKRLIKGADVTIKGLDVFYQFPEGVTFLGTEWSVGPAIKPIPAYWVPANLTRFQGYESRRQERYPRLSFPRLCRRVSIQRTKGPSSRLVRHRS